MQTPALRELQRAFAAALLDEDDRAILPHLVEDGLPAGERLRIYRNTCRSTLVATLRMTYPALERLVGERFFDAVAERYVDAHPAASGYLNDYGGHFAAFVAGLDAVRDLPYLPDVARFEWALSVAANAPDAPILEPRSLLAVDVDDRAALAFEPHPSLQLLALDHPADEIADAVLAGNEAAMREVDLASGPVRLVVHRGQQGLEAERLQESAYAFMSRVCSGERFGALLAPDPQQAAALLGEQLAKGRLSAFRVAR